MKIMSNSNKTVCRACLGSNSRMYDLRNTPLQGIFEKITGAELISGGRSGVCHLCTAQLQSCARFQDMVRRADQFKRVLSKDVESSRLSLRVASYSRTPVDRLSLPEQAPRSVPSHTAGVLSVKVEPVEVKHEFEEFKIEDYSSEADFTMIPQELNMVAAQTAITSDQCLNPEPTIYHCNFCLKEIYSLEHLARHESSHDIEACDICGAHYPRSKRNNHIRKHTKPYKCHVCQKSFSEQSSLKKHVASHSNTKSFTCDTCSKGFTHKSYLVVHIRSHTGEKPYTCQLCAKTFAQTSQLTSHKRTHDKNKLPTASNKRYICDVCCTTFTHRSSIVKHMNLHSLVKTYACAVCGKVFARSDTLACHMRCHTGEKPFKCAACGKAFAAKANYRKHLRSH